MKVIKDTYRYEPYCFLAKENDTILGILPAVYLNSPFFKKCLISVPFAPYGGVCSNSDMIEKALIEKATNMLDTNHCELRNLYGPEEHSYSTFQLELSKDPQHLWEKMSKKKRNRVRKGEKSNLKFEIDPDSTNEFYNIYAINMKKLGTPVHDIMFFKNIRKYFPENVLIAKVLLNNRIISALYLLTFKKTIIAGWGASLPEYLSTAPNDFIYWNTIKYACKNNYTLFDFGRSPSNNTRFKNKWGAKELPLHYHYYPSIEKTPQQKYSTLAKIWTKIPLPLTKKLGPHIRRHIP